MADEPVRLSPRAEELLAAFPVPERDWEADAAAIEARLKGVEPGSTEARWLEAPLAEEAPSAPIPSLPAPKSAPSLAELARSVAAKGSRPQATDIAKESLSVAAAARTHTDAIVERVRSSRVAAPPTASQRASSPRPSSPPPRTPARRAEVSEAQESARAPAPQRSQALPWIAVGGLAVLAGMLLLERTRNQSSVPVAATVVNAPAPSPPPAPSVVVQPPVELARGPAAAAAAADATFAASPNAAPAQPAAARAAAPAGVTGGGSQPASAGPATKPTPSSTPGALAARPEPEAVVLEDAPGHAKVAASPVHSGLRPAAGSPTGGLSDRPSTGAVQAAIGSVMGSARSCVAGSSTAVPAQVTFGSDGSVTGVSVSGAAAGTPAASCIESALKRARVAPFATPSFSLMVWVRP